MFQPNSEDWYRAEIEFENARGSYLKVRLSNGELCYCNGRSVTESPAHIFCHPKRTPVFVRMERNECGDCAYRAIETHIVAEQSEEYEHATVIDWQGRYGEGELVNCRCPILLLARNKKYDPLALKAGEVIRIKIRKSEKTGRYVGIIFEELFSQVN